MFYTLYIYINKIASGLLFKKNKKYYNNCDYNTVVNIKRLNESIV